MYVTAWTCERVWKDSNQILTLVVGILGKDQGDGKGGMIKKCFKSVFKHEKKNTMGDIIDLCINVCGKAE